ncbi:MAG: hypothetical protein CMJ78_09405 [Planctomycetaceae bacterium]|nr:hypothetical protein [Planctomycetaceae bacterium]
MQQGINVLALVKESERFVFLYDDSSPAALMTTLGQYAADKDLSFSWYDAAVLSQKVRRMQQATEVAEVVEDQAHSKTNRLGEITW